MRFWTFFILLLAGCTMTESSYPVPVVPELDIGRFCGRWYEIARSPNFFERGMSDVYAEYTLLANGTLQVMNHGKKAGKLRQIKGKVKFASKEKNGALRVTFFPPFYSDFRIIMLDKEYSLACIMGKNHSLFWILARKAKISDAALSGACDFLKAHNFATEQLHFTRHEAP